MGKMSREQLEQEVIRLGGIEATFNSLEPLLRFALMARDSIMADLENRPDLSSSEIGDRAYELVKEAVVDDVRRKLIQEREEESRAEYYQRVREEVEAKEGHAIYEQVEERINSDPELQVKLRKSAREEIMKRASVKVEGVISAEEEIILEEEAQRQIELDRLDVRFAVDGQLDLKEVGVKDILKPGDNLLIRVRNGGYGDSINLRWTKDVNDREGWIIVEKDKLYDSQRSLVNTDQFVEIGSEVFDLEDGTKVETANVLKKERALAFFTKTKKGKNKGQPKPIALYMRAGTGSYSYNYKYSKPVIDSVDFRTREHALNRRSR